jgi:protein tyrosine phosphatase (PTP) superfamily phosphohydrolase (DUF442 family)
MSDRIEDIYNFVQISDSVATSGQPTEAQFTSIKAAGYRVVINLAPPGSTNYIPHEREIVAGLGMDYVHIPVIWEKPTQEDFDRFTQKMQIERDKLVFVHCAKNMRVSVFVYLYRRIYENIDEANAQKDLDKIWIPNTIWQDFIERAIADKI